MPRPAPKLRIHAPEGGVKVPHPKALKKKGYAHKGTEHQGHWSFERYTMGGKAEGDLHQVILVNHHGGSTSPRYVASVHMNPEQTEYRVDSHADGLLMFHTNPRIEGHLGGKGMQHRTIGPGQEAFIHNLGRSDEVLINPAIAKEHMGVMAVSFGTRPKPDPRVEGHPYMGKFGINDRSLTWIPNVKDPKELPPGWHPPGHLEHEANQMPTMRELAERKRS